jgi:hypothetical protein
MAGKSLAKQPSKGRSPQMLPIRQTVARVSAWLRPALLDI